MLTGKQKRQLETSIYMNKKDKIDNVLSQHIYKTKKLPQSIRFEAVRILRNCILSFITSLLLHFTYSFIQIGYKVECSLLLRRFCNTLFCRTFFHTCNTCN